MHKTTLLAFCLMAVFAACNKHSDHLHFQYAETKCADRWSRYVQWDTQEAKEAGIRAFLQDSSGIGVYSFSLEKDGDADGCEACTCLTGYKIYIHSSEEYRQQLLDLGFKEQ